MNDKEIYNLLDDLLMSYQIVANDEDKMRLTRYYKTLNDFIIEYKTLQSNWNSLREYCEENKYFYSGYQGEDREEDLAIMGVLDKMNELEGKDNNE